MISYQPGQLDTRPLRQIAQAICDELINIGVPIITFNGTFGSYSAVVDQLGQIVFLPDGLVIYNMFRERHVLQFDDPSTNIASIKTALVGSETQRA